LPIVWVLQPTGDVALTAELERPAVRCSPSGLVASAEISNAGVEDSALAALGPYAADLAPRQIADGPRTGPNPRRYERARMATHESASSCHATSSGRGGFISRCLRSVIPHGRPPWSIWGKSPVPAKRPGEWELAPCIEVSRAPTHNTLLDIGGSTTSTRTAPLTPLSLVLGRYSAVAPR
jgi:hypothetical protein